MLRISAVLAAVALATPLAANALVYQFNATINAAQEVPTNPSTATGVATLFYDDKNTVGTGDDNYDFALAVFGLTSAPSVYHIHRGPVGVNGPVIVGLDAAPFVSGGAGGTLLVGGNDVTPPANFLTDLIASNTYVNIHTPAFPGGEVRGQLLQVAVVPEPSSLALLLAGLGVGAFALKRRR